MIFKQSWRKIQFFSNRFLSQNITILNVGIIRFMLNHGVKYTLEK